MFLRPAFPRVLIVIIALLLTAHAGAADVIRIMSVGDSDVEGYAGFVSFRYDLWFMLEKAGYDVDFVGRKTLTGGVVEASLYPSYAEMDKDHEGEYGRTTDALESAARGMALANEPQVVLVMDSHDICKFGFSAPSHAQIHLGKFIDNVRSVDPNVHFLLGQVYAWESPCNPDAPQIIPEFNQKVAAVAASRDTAASRVIAVDHYTDFDVGSMFSPRDSHANRAGEEFIASNWLNALEEILPLVEQEPFAINPGLNDAWYDPATAGQGFLIVVYEDIQLVFMAWFTYDAERPPEDVTAILGEPGHRWLTAQGPIEGNRAELEIVVSEGGVFDSAEPQPENRIDGTIELVFDSCSSGVVRYELDSVALQGEIPIQRVANDNIALCEVLADESP